MKESKIVRLKKKVASQLGQSLPKGKLTIATRPSTKDRWMIRVDKTVSIMVTDNKALEFIYAEDLSKKNCTQEEFNEIAELESVRKFGIGLNDTTKYGNVNNEYLDGDSLQEVLDYMQDKGDLTDITTGFAY